MGEDFPARRFALAGDVLGVERDHDALRPVAIGRFGHEVGVRDGGGVDRHLVGPGRKQPPHVGQGSDAAANGQRDEHFASHAFDHFHERAAIFVACRDVEKDEFIGALLIVTPRDLDRIAGILDLEELDALDDPALVDIQAGDDAFGQAHADPFDLD